MTASVTNICQKACQKLRALSRISPYLETNNKELLFKSIEKSQFSYYPLVLMFCSRNANNFVNKTQERSLRLLKNDKPSTFEHLLQANNERKTDQRNVQVLMVEVFKIINGFAPPIMEDFFLFHKNTHDIRNFEMISNESKKTVRYGLEMVKHRALLLWANLPEKYKTATSLNSFKTKTKTWKCQTCLCPLCQTYLKYLQFLYVVFEIVLSSPFQPSVALLYPLKASENAMMS